jgi:hypothetical protein
MDGWMDGDCLCCAELSRVTLFFSGGLLSIQCLMDYARMAVASGARLATASG